MQEPAAGAPDAGAVVRASAHRSVCTGPRPPVVAAEQRLRWAAGDAT
ncbi:hypothetical protein [Nocardia gamkensis]